MQCNTTILFVDKAVSKLWFSIQTFLLAQCIIEIKINNNIKMIE
jgi:hypothetical protein